MTQSPFRSLIDMKRNQLLLADKTIAKFVDGSAVAKLGNDSLLGVPSSMQDNISSRNSEGRANDPLLSKSLANSFAGSQNAFIHESFMDEIAAAGKVDPLDLRRKLMAPYPVAIKLIDAVEKMSDWKAPLPEGRARGFAFTLSYGTWVAEVVQVAQKDDGIRIEKVFCAADAGAVFEVRDFRAQLISGILNGLESAIGLPIDFADCARKAPAQSYPCPQIEVELLSNSSHMGAAEEPAAPPILPALANAIFALNGTRIRSMPLTGDVTFV